MQIPKNHKFAEMKKENTWRKVIVLPALEKHRVPVPHHPLVAPPQRPNRQRHQDDMTKLFAWFIRKIE
jgi:hypothetical protein